jgi:glutamine amidotransferase
MCRLLGYLGPAIALDTLILEPPHSLVVQSYAPKELAVAKLNADGFGLGWYHATNQVPPFTYRNISPIWNDPNLESLCRYITTGCAVTYVRSATPGQGVDLINCQPFTTEQILFAHNGYIRRFRETLHRPLREAMSDRAYAAVHGSTDSEHIWGLLLTSLESIPERSLVTAVEQTLNTLMHLATKYQTALAANVLVSDGKNLVFSRLAHQDPAPSLYWLKDDPRLPQAVLVASEPIFPGNWQSCPACSLFTVDTHCDIQIRSLSPCPATYPG